MKTHAASTRRRATALLAGLLLLAQLAAPRPAAAQIPVTDVVHIAQTILHYIARGIEISQRYIVIANQYEQLVYQLQALKKLKDPNFREIASLLGTIDLILKQGDSLVYSLGNLNLIFLETFPGWEEVTESYHVRSAKQAERTLTTLRNALNTLYPQYRRWTEDQLTLAGIKEQVRSISGHEEALELAATLDAFTAEELLLLRQQVATSVNVSSVYFAAQINERAQAEATFTTLAARSSHPLRPPSPGFTFRPPWWPFA